MNPEGTATQEEIDAELAERVRASLSVYPAAKENIAGYILRSLAATVEVFLHSSIGERYLTWPRVAVGLVVMWLVTHLVVIWQWFSALLGHMRYEPLALTWFPVGTVLRFEIKLPVLGAVSAAGAPPLAIALALYFAMAQWRILEIFIKNRLGAATHSRSSGDCFPFWDKFYVWCHRLNFRGDLVKQVCEPAICVILAWIIYRLDTAYHSIALWLAVSSAALFVKAWLENRTRKGIVYDQIDSQYELEAYRLQESFLTPAAAKGFDEVPSLTPSPAVK